MRGLSRKLYYFVVEPEESKMIYFTCDAIIFHAKFHSLFITLINTQLHWTRVKVKTVYIGLNVNTITPYACMPHNILCTCVVCNNDSMHCFATHIHDTQCRGPGVVKLNAGPVQGHHEPES